MNAHVFATGSLQQQPGPARRAAPSAYRVRLAQSDADVQAAQALRFEVFNLELDEGLVHSWDTGLDADPFDAVCQHLLVEDEAGIVVGTYRMQTGAVAAQQLGYYSEREFDFAPFAPMRAQMLELGRACIAEGHRSFAVINGLWKGIAAYARSQGARYLVGCSSLTSQDEASGIAAHAQMAAHWAPPGWRTQPQPGFACRAPDGSPLPPPPRIPRLLSAYLALGAVICGPPAIDRDFRSIDFLTMLDLESTQVQALQARGRFLG